MPVVGNTESYIGKLVLIERANPTKEYSSTYDGERLVFDATPNQLFTIDLTNSYGGLTAYGLGGYSSSGRVPLFGIGKYNIIRVNDVPDRLWDRLDDVQKEIDDVKTGRKKAAWVENVYDKAQGSLDRLKQLRDEVRNPPGAVQAAVQPERYPWAYDMNFSGMAYSNDEVIKIRAYLAASQRNLSAWLSRQR